MATIVENTRSVAIAMSADLPADGTVHNRKLGPVVLRLVSLANREPTQRYTRSPPTGGEAKRRATRIRPKAVIIGRFSNVDNFRPEVRSDIISGMVVGPMGVKASVKLGDSRSNRSRDIRLPQFVRTTTTTTPVIT